MLVLSVILLVFVVLYCLRRAHISKAQRLLHQPMAGIPEGLEQQWRARYTDYGLPEGIAAIHVLYELTRIDAGVLEAIDTSRGANAFESFRELMSHVEDKFSIGERSVDGLVSLYKGYYGEASMAQVLRDQGHHVEMATSPNQEGWDAIVDGEAVQIKSGLDPRGIEEHFERNPEIPVLTVSEHAEYFADNELVTALPISGEEIEKATEATLEGIDGLGDVGISFPVVTATISIARNLHLVWKGDSDLVTAVTFTLSDTAGVGVGGWAGAKAGIFAGAALGPVGAAVGGLLGGLVGAVVGREMSAKFKQRKLCEAQAAIESALAELPNTYLHAVRQKASAIDLSAQRAAPRGLRAWLWPNYSDIARREVASMFAGWSDRCKGTAQALELWLQEERDPTMLARKGRELLTDPATESVSSAAFNAIRSRISNASRRVVEESKKLGRTAAVA